MELNQQDATPLYLQLKNTIKGYIDSGDIQTNEKLPSEAQLCEKYKVSRITVRNALAELEEEGYLIKKQGKGAYATKPRLFRPLEDTIGFSASCKAAGKQCTSIVLKKELHPLDERMKELLKLEEDDQVLYIQRLRYADGDPLMLENNYYSYKKFGFLMEEPLTGSLYELLQEKKKIDCDRSLKTIITVTSANYEQAKLLQVSIGAPLFVMDTLGGDSHNEPVHYGLQYIVGEKYSFVRKNTKA